MAATSANAVVEDVKEKNKTPAQDDKITIRNSVKASWKTNQVLQSNRATLGVIADSSTARKRLLAAGRIAKKLILKPKGAKE